jgi:hypothetical protein
MGLSGSEGGSMDISVDKGWDELTSVVWTLGQGWWGNGQVRGDQQGIVALLDGWATFLGRKDR